MKIEVEFSEEYLRDVISGAAIRYWAKQFAWTGADCGFLLTERDTDKEFVISSDQVAEALAKMAKRRSSNIGQLIARTDDADTGDALVQYCCFGELKYG